MKTNTKSRRPVTHEGGPASLLSPVQALRRSVMSCLLWEDGFYEDGVSISERIDALCDQVDIETIADIAYEARVTHGIRHAPLLLLKAMIRRGGGATVANAIYDVISRADEMGELISLYWKDGKRPLSNAMKRGLAMAFTQFDSYQLAKYQSSKSAAVSLRDVMFLCHPTPTTQAQAADWALLAENRLPTPDTWEVALSGGADKKETFERLLREKKIGYLALLRNLRNMVTAGCDARLIQDAILERRGADKVLPFRFVAAARAVPSLEPFLDAALLENLSSVQPLSGHTIVLVDVSGSMDALLSSKSDMNRMDAAATLASIVQSETHQVLTFSNEVIEVPPRMGMAGVDTIIRSQTHASTHLGLAVEVANRMPHDRLIVVSDEQSSDPVPAPVARHAYMINVAPFGKGIGYSGGWTHIDGFSESVLRYISFAEGVGK